MGSDWSRALYHAYHQEGESSHRDHQTSPIPPCVPPHGAHRCGGIRAAPAHGDGLDGVRPVRYGGLLGRPSPGSAPLPDLPWGTRPVRLHLTVRHVIGRHAAYLRRIFTDRLDALLK